MLIKKSSKNQIAIPGAILRIAGLTSEDVYFDVVYKKGHIVLTPVEVEEKIPIEALKRFEENTKKIGPGDKVFNSMDEAIKWLHRKRTK